MTSEMNIYDDFLPYNPHFKVFHNDTFATLMAELSYHQLSPPKLRIKDAQNGKLTKEINRFDNSGLAAEGELKIQHSIYMELFTQNIILFITVIIFIITMLKNIKK